jgi:hypothetical protein
MEGRALSGAGQSLLLAQFTVAEIRDFRPAQLVSHSSSAETNANENQRQALFSF